MTEEQTTKLVELLEEYTTGLDKSVTIISVLIGVFLLSCVAMLMWEIYRMKKVKQWKDEYYATLTDDQKKAVSQWRDINK